MRWQIKLQKRFLLIFTVKHVIYCKIKVKKLTWWRPNLQHNAPFVQVTNNNEIPTNTTTWITCYSLDCWSLDCGINRLDFWELDYNKTLLCSWENWEGENSLCSKKSVCKGVSCGENSSPTKITVISWLREEGEITHL